MGGPVHAEFSSAISDVCALFCVQQHYDIGLVFVGEETESPGVNEAGHLVTFCQHFQLFYQFHHARAPN